MATTTLRAHSKVLGEQKMFRESHDTYLSEYEDIQNTVGWDVDRFLEDKSESIVKANQELKELQTNIFKKISLKLWLVKLLFEGKIIEEQFNDMLEEYDCKIRELVNRRKVVLHANNEDLISLNTELNKSKIFLAEIEKRKEISDISEEEYLVKKGKFEWEINHYQNDISIRTEVLSFLESPYNTISRIKYNEMKQEAKRRQENIEKLNTSDNISFNTIKKIKISIEELVEHLRGYNLTQQKQLDSLDFDEAKFEIKQPISPEILDERYARDETLEQLDSLDFDKAKFEIKQPISPAIPDERYARDETLEQLDSLDFDKAEFEIKQPISPAIPDEYYAGDESLKLLDSLDFDETDVEIEHPIHSAILDEHYARVEPLEQEFKTEEIIEENKSLRVECPYTNVYGEKCKVIAFSKKKAEAYQKLKTHVIKKHPEKIKEFTDIIKKIS